MPHHSTLHYIKWLLLYCFACVRNLPYFAVTATARRWWWMILRGKSFFGIGIYWFRARTHTEYTEENKYLSFVTTFFSFVCSRCHRAGLYVFVCLFVCIKPIVAKCGERTERRLCACLCLCLCVCVCRSVCSDTFHVLAFLFPKCVSIFLSPDLNTNTTSVNMGFLLLLLLLHLYLLVRAPCAAAAAAAAAV